MSSKLKRKNKKKNVIKAAPVQKRNQAKTIKAKSLVQTSPKLSALVLVVTYFLMDYIMMDSGENLHKVLIVIFTMLAPSTLYSYYAVDYQRGLYPSGGTDMPKFAKDKRRFAVIGWLVITIYGILFLIAEPFIVPRFFPMLNATYCQSQIMLMLFVAPVMEEIIFRYLLYDRWLRRKWGPVWGLLAASLIFVVCHPVTNMHALIIYWVPTLLFFLIYREFGLYGAIVMHMIYNIVAI